MQVRERAEVRVTMEREQGYLRQQLEAVGAPCLRCTSVARPCLPSLRCRELPSSWHAPTLGGTAGQVRAELELHTAARQLLQRQVEAEQRAEETLSGPTPTARQRLAREIEAALVEAYR